MSQNTKSTEYTVVTDTGIPKKKRVAVFSDSEIEQMLSHMKSELYEECYHSVLVMRETTTTNNHKDGDKKQVNTRIRRILVESIYSTLPKGFYNWLGYPPSNGR